MKKQLLIAAVAATMGTAAIADISITGNMKVNYKNTDTNGATVDTVTQEGNLVLAGSNGGTTVHVEVAIDGATAGIATEDLWLSTNIGDIAVKTGTWNGSDSTLGKDSDRTSGNWVLSTAVSGIGIALEGDTATSATKVTISGSVAGVTASFADSHTKDEIKLSTSISGFDVAYYAINDDGVNKDESSITVAKEINGMTFTYAQSDAEAAGLIDGDTSYFGNTANFMTTGDDVSSFQVSTSLAGNTVKARFVSVDTVAAGDTDVNTFTLTRPLANGTTFEATYTDTDKVNTASDTEVLDLELSVKF